MEIKIIDNSIKTNDETKNYVSLLIIEYCNRLGISSDCIEKIIFSDENNYINEINKIDPLEDFTNTPSYKGIGKTLYIPERNTNVIIYNSAIFINLVFMLNKYELKEETIQVTLHLLLHEIGHCITNCKDKTIIRSGGSKLFNITDLPIYYFSIIIDEYSANRNIINFINKNWVLSELENNYIPDFITLSKSLLSFRDIEFVQNIWFLFKRIMDIGVFLIDYEKSEYISYLNILELPFDINRVISSFISYNHGIITKNELFYALSDIANEILDRYYKIPMNNEGYL